MEMDERNFSVLLLKSIVNSLLIEAQLYEMFINHQGTY